MSEPIGLSLRKCRSGQSFLTHLTVDQRIGPGFAKTFQGDQMVEYSIRCHKEIDMLAMTVLMIVGVIVIASATLHTIRPIAKNNPFYV